jgi:hypothetical protein
MTDDARTAWKKKDSATRAQARTPEPVARPVVSEPVLLVINNPAERRYYFSATQLVRNLGYMARPNAYSADSGQVAVYRLDVEATEALTAELHANTIGEGDYTPSTGKWLPHAIDKFKEIVIRHTSVKD